MAADVSSLVRVLNGYKDDQHGGSEKSTALITRDLLGGSSPSKLVSDAQELDLDLQVPCGWEKRLDLKSGKVYLQRCNSQLQQPSKSQENLNLNSPAKKLSSSSAAKKSLNLFDDSSLDLKLVSGGNSGSGSAYQSVCTLDKVRSALERADTTKRRSSSESSSSSDSTAMIMMTSSTSAMTSPVAAGCPGCLSYVLVTKNNPKCPRCNTNIPLPLAKKPRLDLNITI